MDPVEVSAPGAGILEVLALFFVEEADPSYVRGCTLGFGLVIWKISRKIPGATIENGLTITCGLSIRP
jgi:hypothetical protein